MLEYETATPNPDKPGDATESGAGLDGGNEERGSGQSHGASQSEKAGRSRGYSGTGQSRGPQNERAGGHRGHSGRSRRSGSGSHRPASANAPVIPPFNSDGGGLQQQGSRYSRGPDVEAGRV